MTARFATVFLAILLVSATAGRVMAQTTAASAPHQAEIPPGYHVLTVGTRQIICEPTDDDWVRTAASAVAPSKRPTTMPSDILAALAQRRSDLTAMVQADFALSDPKAFSDCIDQDLIPQLSKFQALSPAVYYFPITHDKLLALMQNGWTDPRYHYLRFAHQVDYSDGIAISIDHPMDDLVMWVEIKETDSPQARGDALIKGIAEFETQFPVAVSLFGQSGTRNVFADFLLNQEMVPLKLAATEGWFAHSVSELYAIKYATFLTGSSRRGLISVLLRGDPRNPLDWPPLDLVHPLDPGGMWPEYRKIYDNAVIRKGSFVVDSWMNKGGDGVLAKALPALRAGSPQNAADLIKIIQQSTGIDLTPVMLPFYTEVPPQL